MSQRVEAVWRAAAEQQPVPAALAALQSPESEAHVILSGNRVIFGLSRLEPAALDVALAHLSGGHRRDLIGAVFQRLIANRRGVQWSLALEGDDAAPTLHLSAMTRTSTGAAANLSELREVLSPALGWPAALPESGALTGWSVAFSPEGGCTFSVDAPARSAWLPSAAHRSLRDLPEVGAVRISSTPEGTLRYASRTLIDEDDHDACWEAALVPLAAYGRDHWAHRLVDVPGAIPAAISLDGEDITLELRVS